MHDVLVVGAGLAGLACARDLARAGRRVLVLDKSRGVSGRAATRRLEDGGRVDHGAQFFTAKGERLTRLVEAWTTEGWVREWSRGFPVWRDGTVHARPEGHPRFAARDGMSALGRHLVRDLDVVTEATVTSLKRYTDGWEVFTADGQAWSAGALVLNLPAPQLAPLVEGVALGAAGEALDRVRFDPAWTLIVELERDLDVAWPALEVEHEVLAWVSRDHTKRPPGAPPVLVAHASGGWSRAHLEDDREGVRQDLLAALRAVVGEVTVRRDQLHRWRFATPTVVFPERHHWDESLHLGWCGDWCGGPRVEGALESGWSLAAAVRRRLQAQDELQARLDVDLPS